MSSLKDLSLAIVTGGWSAERHENLTGARAVRKTLTENGIDPAWIEVKREQDFIPELSQRPLDFALLCMTEEVPIQGVLDSMRIPYSGSGVLATALCLDKQKSKQFMLAAGVHTPAYYAFDVKDIDMIPDHGGWNVLEQHIGFGFPMVVKPNACGSSVGVSLVTDPAALPDALQRAAEHGGRVLIEQYIQGTEVTCPALGDKIFPAVEVRTPSGIYDYSLKERCAASYSIVPESEKLLRAALEETVATLRRVFSLENIWRVDAIWDGTRLYVLEVNTLPYLGSPSGVMATSFRAFGLDHYQFLTAVIGERIQRGT